MAFLPLDTKSCRECKQDLPRSSFHKRSDSKDGLQYVCAPCMKAANNTPEMKKYRREIWQKSAKKKIEQNPHYVREKHLKKQYGIDYAEYQRMFIEQDGKCPCGRSEPEGFTGGTFLHVDHDHETGAVRGLLCPNCNKVLGLVYDNPDTLVILAAYLIKAKEGK